MKVLHVFTQLTWHLGLINTSELNAIVFTVLRCIYKNPVAMLGMTFDNRGSCKDLMQSLACVVAFPRLPRQQILACSKQEVFVTVQYRDGGRLRKDTRE